MKSSFLIIFLASSLAWAGRVKHNDTGNPPPPSPPTDTTSNITKITINDPAAVLLPSRTIQLTVTATPTSALNNNLIWQSKNNGTASFNSTGMVSGRTEGTATVLAINAEQFRLLNVKYLLAFEVI